MHPLDRPVWAALSTDHAELSCGGLLAKRYRPNVNVFAAAKDDTPEALAALTALVGVGEQIYIAQVPAVIVPPGLVVAKRSVGVQMVAPAAMPAVAADDIAALDEADAPEMLALASLTEPGPFRPRTRVMGDFFGIRVDGRLAAMAGERFRCPGYCEVSAVCSHPDFRGAGLARRLTALVTARILARGDTPFLHAWKSNAPAIALYESLGFSLRAEIDVVQLERA
jgi:predicted GNAT family acetyltransferase